MYPDVYVIVPVFNEATVLEGVLANLTRHFQNVVCVDDGSTDDSAKIIRKSGAVLLCHEQNKGQGAAFRTGFQYALNQKNVRYIVTFDADGQHRVEDAIAMLGHAERNNFAVVLGSRFLGAAPGMTFARKVVLKLAVRFTHAFTTLPLTDTHNGLRVIRSDFAKKLSFKFNGMAYASEVELAIAKHRVSYEEYPVTIVYTKYSRSKGQSSLNGFNIVWDLMTEKLRDRYSAS